MLLFLDTEFTDFIDIDVISIGIVSEDEREFYGERSDFDRSACSQFVHAAVLPQLGRGGAIVGTKGELRKAVLSWLGQFEDVEICVDYSTDWDLFLDLCGDPETNKAPAGVRGRNISGEIDECEIERYWRENGRQDHHALHDAKANRFAFLNRPIEQ